MTREVYFRTIKAILMGVGEDDKDATSMTNSLLDDKDISNKNAFDIAKGYAEARQGLGKHIPSEELDID